MEVFQASQDLTRERLGDVLVEFAVLQQTTPDGTSRDILKETTRPKKETISSCNHTVISRHLHAEIRRRLFESLITKKKPYISLCTRRHNSKRPHQILHDIRMIKILERLTLQLQRLHNRHLARIILITSRSRYLHLLHSNHLPRRRVQSQIHTTICTSPNKLPTHPLERRCT